ncbi:MAG: ribonuclease P protein component [Candidatus Saccharimonas sp.]|nr:ribonuclease P protein component [Candidatus Saccharimonas sp.]
MISRSLRFHGHGSLKYLYKNAATFRSRHLTIRCIENPRRKHSRFAVVVSKKVHKSAIGRNRIRRRIYEILRGELPTMRKTADIAVIVTSGEVLMMPSVELKRSVQEQLRQTNIFTP